MLSASDDGGSHNRCWWCGLPTTSGVCENTHPTYNHMTAVGRGYVIEDSRRPAPVDEWPEDRRPPTYHPTDWGRE